MTAMSASTREIDIDTLTLRAYQLAGLMPMEATASGVQWEARGAYARDMLEMIVKNIQAEGGVTTNIELYTVTLEAGEPSYAMPSSTLRVFGVAMYRESSTTDELQVREMDRDEYQRISNKDEAGRPVRYYAARSSVITLNLWMVPDVDASTLVVQRERLLGNTTDPTASVDLERSWNKYLLWELAHHLAVSGGQEIQRCGYLRSGADKAYTACKSTSAQSTPGQIYVDHSGGVY